MGTHPIFESDFDCLTDMPRPKITFDSDSEDSDNVKETATPTFLTTSTVFQQRRLSVLEKLKQANETWSKVVKPSISRKSRISFAVKPAVIERNETTSMEKVQKS